MISVIIPTRKRPAWLTRTIESIRATSEGPVEVVCYADDDDLPSAALCAALGVKCVVGPRIIVTDCWNKCLPLAEGELVMQGNDDVIFRTRGWDRMVERAFDETPDKILLVHGSDEGQHFQKFGAHCIVHRRWIDALGYFIAPYFSSDYGDTWLNELANKLGRRRYLPFIVEHMHFLFKKAPIDENSRERLARHKADNVDRIWIQKQPQRDADVKKLRALLGKPLELSA